MNTAIFAYSRQGCIAARGIADLLSDGEVRMFTAQRLKQQDFGVIPRPGADFYGQQFRWADALIFVGSCGIAVRAIAPHVRDKHTDPAVVVVDERETYAIPLLSGHVGGANDLARSLAKAIGAVAVVTTATDLTGRFSVDVWAEKNGLLLEDPADARDISAAVLEGDVPLCSDLPVKGHWPAGVLAGNTGKIGIYVGYRLETPFAQTLRLIPPVLHLGIGCRKGSPVEAIGAAVDAVLEENRLDRRAVKCVASIDFKAGEPGLREFAQQNRWELNGYSAERLMAVPGAFSASDFVKSVAGVDTVCERAAMVGAARLIVRKTALNGVTVAVAAGNREVSFG